MTDNVDNVEIAFGRVLDLLSSMEVEEYKRKEKEDKVKSLERKKILLQNQLEEKTDQLKEKLMGMDASVAELESNRNIAQLAKGPWMLGSSFSQRLSGLKDLRKKYVNLQRDKLELEEKVTEMENQRLSISCDAMRRRNERKAANLETILTFVQKEMEKLRAEQEKVKDVLAEITRLNLKFYPLREALQKRISELEAANLSVVASISKANLDQFLVQSGNCVNFELAENKCDARQTELQAAEQRFQSLNQEAARKEQLLAVLRKTEQSAKLALHKFAEMKEKYSKNGRLNYLKTELENLENAWEAEKLCLLAQEERNIQRMESTILRLKEDISFKKKKLMKLEDSRWVVKSLLEEIIMSAICK